MWSLICGRWFPYVVADPRPLIPTCGRWSEKKLVADSHFLVADSSPLIRGRWFRWLVADSAFSRGPLLGVQMLKKCTPLCREAHFQSKCSNYHMLGPLYDDLMAIWCRKRERRCGEKHIWKSNVSTTGGFEPLLMCQMSFCWQINGHRKS